MTKQITRCGILAALAILIGWIEAQIPIPIPVPGVKLGLANIVVLFALYLLNRKEAFAILLIKVAATGLLFSGATGFLYSLSGGLVSFLAMCLCQKWKAAGVIGVSVMGAVFHNVGQILMALWVLKTLGLLYYLGLLMLAGTVMGIVTGMVAYLVLKRLSGMKMDGHSLRV